MSAQTLLAPPRRRRGTLALGGGLALLAVAAVVALVLARGRPRTPATGSDNAAPTALATVTRRSLSSQSQVSGTLGYAGSATLLNQAGGAYTWLPTTGSALRFGHVAYRVDDKPVVLLRGHTPAYRALSEGESGPDVQQLNAGLVALGYARRSVLDPSSDEFGWATLDAVERLQHHLGVTETGSLALGDVAFAPRALRVTSLSAALGAPAQPGAPVAKASSTTRRVEIALDVAQQSDVRAGEHVTVTLPDQSVTSGVVARVGTVASGGSDEPGGGGPTVEVQVRLRHPRATGSLDEAPVSVAITTGTVHDVLVVPVNALLAPASGGYAVEVAGAHGARTLVPVQTGLFDDADGLVQVTGSRLAAGQRVVVPAGS